MAPSCGAPKNAKQEVAFVERQIRRLDPLSPRVTRGLSPSRPQRSSRALLEDVASVGYWSSSMAFGELDQKHDQDLRGSVLSSNTTNIATTSALTAAHTEPAGGLT